MEGEKEALFCIQIVFSVVCLTLPGIGLYFGRLQCLRRRTDGCAAVESAKLSELEALIASEV
jgi:hypothetical protein